MPAKERFTSETDPLAEREGFEHSVPRKGTTFFWQQLASPPVTVGSVQLCHLHTDSPKLLCSAINPIERLVEHVFVPVAVPCLHIGFDLLEQIGARPLLGGEPLRTEL